MSTVIKVENLSKQYRLGEIGTGTISHDINRWWHKVRGKEDPYLKIGEANDRTAKGNSDYVWSLRDINFEVKAGEVLGVIGRNGAGKSTLLKILSKTTTPTTGSIKVKGRIASLLEVGTGFHPELSGRDNIFLNGAILGMTKQEIKSKFDEIVDFSGVERYIDTPVKRYSSGMYVRLAFAVAAHLEPEILIVDEVLAVGDAEFQKKCLGKMKDVSVNDGRTVLFVSHNMSAIQTLCDKGIYLQNGEIKYSGDIKNCINHYLTSGILINSENEKFFSIVNGKDCQITEIRLVNENKQLINKVISNTSCVFINVKYLIQTQISRLHLTYYLRNESGDIIFFSDRTDYHEQYLAVEPGTYSFRLKIPINFLIPGKYYLTTYCGNEDSGSSFVSQDDLCFEIENVGTFRTQKRDGYFYCPVEWEKIENEV